MIWTPTVNGANKTKLGPGASREWFLTNLNIVIIIKISIISRRYIIFHPQSRKSFGKIESSLLTWYTRHLGYQEWRRYRSWKSPFLTFSSRSSFWSFFTTVPKLFDMSPWYYIKICVNENGPTKLWRSTFSEKKRSSFEKGREAAKYVKSWTLRMVKIWALIKNSWKYITVDISGNYSVRIIIDRYQLLQKLEKSTSYQS